MNEEHYLNHVIVPTLEYLDPEIKFSNSACMLILLTSVVESNLSYLEQINGPALGFIQMEPKTEQSLWDNYLRYREKRKKLIESLVIKSLPRELNLKSNLFYQVAMARVQYLPVPEPLPSIYDTLGMAEYYKHFYNTMLGKSNMQTVEETYIRLLNNYG